MYRHFLLLLASSSVAAAQAPFEPERGWSIVRADIEVRIDAGAGGLRTRGVLELVLDGKDESSGPTVGINARDSLMTWTDLSCEGASVERGKRHPKRPATDLAQVRFQTPRRRGARVTLRFSCAMAKAGRQLAVGPDMALASWVEAWYPIPEPPEGTSLSGATRCKGKTTFDLPAGWSAVTNGALGSRREFDGRVVEVWSTDRALSRSFAAAPYRRTFQKTDRLTASLYLLSDRTRDPGAHARALARAIEAMEARLGRYPFASFSIAEVPTRLGAFGASSEQGFILVKPFFLAVEGGNLPLFAHEAAHAWWGNTVGSQGPGALLCTESLAQYGAVLAIEALEGRAAATAFLRFSRAGYIPTQCARGYFDLLRKGEDKPLAQLRSGGGTDHTLADAKGHWVYHMLRRRVGDEVFFATLRGLIAAFDGRTMTLDAVRDSFAKAAPQAGLEPFFRQWLDRAGAPVVEARCAGGQLEVRQLQAGAPFVLDLDVELRMRGGGEALRRRLRIGAGKDERLPLHLPADAAVESVVVDPDHALLLWHPSYGPAPDGTVEDDPVVAADVRAVYLGDYAVQGRDLTVRVVERGERLGLIVGDGAREDLLPAGEHRFRTGNGRIRFAVEAGRARSLEFRSDGGRTVRADRR